MENTTPSPSGSVRTGGSSKTGPATQLAADSAPGIWPEPKPSLWGLYFWFWYTLSGLALFNQDRPQLPSENDLDARLPMFSCERAGNKVERLARV